MGEYIGAGIGFVGGMFFERYRIMVIGLTIFFVGLIAISILIKWITT